MKVLSLKEPFASLIKEGKKKIETRSWRTHYRGELYIHASSTKIPNEWRDDEKLMSIVGDIPFNYGNIICKCVLEDCILMTNEFVEDMRKNNYQEYVCGMYKEGRYAWILKDIQPLKEPIKAKGKLNVWEFTPS